MKKKITLKKALIMVGLILVGIVLLIALGFLYLTNGVYGPSHINNEKEVLSFLREKFPDEEYQVIGSMQYEFDYINNTNCKPSQVLIRKWKVKNVATGETHEVYEDIDIWIRGTADGKFIEENDGACSRIPTFRE